MANIPEQPAAWPPVRLIATTDRVLGGEEGAANQQAVAILQRAQYLLVGLQAAQTAVDDAQQRVTSALSTASTAATAAGSASTLADTARTLALAAQTAAGTADTKAMTAQTMASAADSKAAAAQTAASTADTKASTADTKAAAAQVAVAAKATRYDLGTISVTYSATAALGAGSTWVEANCPGALIGDAIFVSPTAAVTFPYGIGAAQCLAVDKIRVCINHPALVLGGGFTIPVKAFALR